MMELANEYDFVVLGEHPAGLWAAWHLLSLDQKVLILPMGTDSGLNVLPKKVATDFGWLERDLVDRDQDPIQILIPGHRFRLGATLEGLKQEFRFHFGKEFESLELPDADFLRGLSFICKGAETGPVLPEDWLELSERTLNTVYFEQEKGYLTRALLRKLSEAGAHVPKAGQLKQIFIDRKNFVGVQLAGSSKMIAGKNALLGAHFDHLKTFMSEVLDLKSNPIGWTFDIRFECSREVLPVGMSTRMIYVEKNAPILEIIQERPGLFNLRTMLPMVEATLARDEERRLAERMLKVAERLIPDLEYNLKTLRPDLRDPEKVETMDLPALYPFLDLKKIPVHRLNYGVGSALGVQTQISNLYLVGPESNPKEGLWGAYGAARYVFDSITKKNPSSPLNKMSSRLTL